MTRRAGQPIGRPLTAARSCGVDDTILQAEARGFTLVARIVDAQYVWAWHRGASPIARWPSFATRREAIAWMDDRLRRAAFFEAPPTEQ